MRNRKIKSLQWINENEFNCVFEYRLRRRGDDGQIYETVDHEAGYGWSKGGSFFVYTIGNGHIQKLGTVKRMQVEVDFPPGL